MNFLTMLSAEGINIFDFNTIWWFLSRGVLNIIEGLNQAFYILAGVVGPYVGGETAPGLGANATDDSLLLMVFRSPAIQNTFWSFMCVALFVVAICVLIAILKNIMTEDKGIGKLHGGTMGRTVKSLVFMIATPLLFIVSLFGVSTVLNFICGAMGAQIGSESASVAQSLFEVSFPEGITDKVPNWGETTYDSLKQDGANESFDYTLCIFAGCLLIFALVKVCILLVERFIDILWLYLIAPFTIAKIPLDNDKSNEQWKEQVLVKFLSVAGIIICMYLYFFIMPQINDALKNDDTITGIAKMGRTFTRLLFIIGGAFAVSKGSVKLATLISAGAAQTEGMSAAETSRMMSGGARMAIGGITKTAGGAMAGGIGGIMGTRAMAGMNGGGMFGAGGAMGGVAGAAGGLSPGAVGGAGAGGGAQGANMRKAQKMASRQARQQQQFMTGTNFGSVAARGGIGGMIGFGASKLIGAAAKGIGAAGRAVSNKIKPKNLDDGAAIGGKGAGAWKRSIRADERKHQKAERQHQKDLTKGVRQAGGGRQAKNEINNHLSLSNPPQGHSTRIDDGFNKKLDSAEKDLNKLNSYLDKQNMPDERKDAVRQNLMGSKLAGMEKSLGDLEHAGLKNMVSAKTQQRLNALKGGNVTPKVDK